MTDIGNIRSFITADSTDLDQKLDKAGQKTDSFARRATKNFKKVGDEMRAMGKTMSLAVTLPLAAAGAGLLKLASDAEETQNKFDVVFSSISEDANAAATSMAAGYNLAGDEAQGLLADTGDLLTGLGFAQDAALDLSVTSNQLAADLASFTNIQGGTTRAAEAVTKAMLGEREMLKALGISVNEAMVKEQMLTNTQKGLTFQTEMQAKAFATLNLIQKQSPNAIGDTARSMASFASMMRRATADTRDMAISFGQELMPVALIALDWAKDIAAAFGNLSPQTQRLAIVIGVVAAAIGPLLFIGGTLISMFLGMLSAVVPVIIVLGSLGAAIVALPAMFDAMAKGIENVSLFFGDVSAFLQDETADIAESSRTNLEIAGKAWLTFNASLELIAVTMKTIAQGFAVMLLAADSLGTSIGESLGIDVKDVSARTAMLEDFIATMEESKVKNFEALQQMEEDWNNAPEALRRSVNSMVATFEALPAGIVTQLESAFPGAVEAVRNLVAQVQGFINSGELPPITLPVVPGAAGGGEGGGGADMLGVSDMEAIGAEIDKAVQIQAKATSAIRGMWMGVGRTYASVFGQMGSLMKQNSREQKAFAIASIILDTAIGIMKAMELPYPMNWAQAAAVAVLGVTQLASIGGSGGGSSAVSESGSGSNFADQTAVSGGVSNSQVIGTPEDQLEPGNVVMEAVVSGDDLAFVLTRAVSSRGAGDGVNTLMFQGA